MKAIIILVVLLLLIAGIIGFVIKIYNEMVRLRNSVKNSMAQIDTQLQRRFDLIPNLVETVKGYAAHEKELLENVTASRNGYMNASSAEERMIMENQLSAGLRNLFAVVENYPELKADSPQIQWAIDECSDLTWLPSMQSDIMLFYGKNILIIDAKYYVKNMTMRYSDQQKLHSGNLYQIFTYVKNMQAEAIDCNVSGLLLYAQTKDDIQPDAECMMHGNKISAKTLDLSQPFAGIAAQLDKIAQDVMDV